MVDLTKNPGDGEVDLGAIRFSNTRRAVLRRREAGFELFDLAGQPLFRGRSFVADGNDAIDVGEGCVVRAVKGAVIVDHGFGATPERPDALQTANVTDIGVPRALWTDRTCGTVLVVGTAGNALLANFAKRQWQTDKLPGEPSETWTASPNLEHIASFDAGDGSVNVWDNTNKTWNFVALYDVSSRETAQVSSLQLHNSGLMFAELWRSFAIFDQKGRLRFQPEQMLDVSVAAFSDDGHRLALYERNVQRLSVFDAGRTKLSEPVSTEVPLRDNERVVALASCVKGELAVGGDKGSVVVLDTTATAAVLRTSFFAEDYVRRIDCADGKMASVTSDAGIFAVYGDSLSKLRETLTATSGTRGAHTFPLGE